MSARHRPDDDALRATVRTGNLDIVLWPERTVRPGGPSVDGHLPGPARLLRFGARPEQACDIEPHVQTDVVPVIGVAGGFAPHGLLSALGARPNIAALRDFVARYERKPFLKTLYGQVLVATVAGVAVGYFHPHAGVAMKPLGDGFIALVRMMIAPIIFCTVVVGVAGVGDVKAVGKTGGLALAYFEIVSTIALAIGLVVVNVVRPGAGMNVDPATLDPQAVSQYVGVSAPQSLTDSLLAIIPATAVDAFEKGNIIQVLLFSILFGFALHGIGDAGAPVLQFVDRLSRVLFGVVGIVMKAAPLGAFGAMAFTVGNFGVGTLAQLGKLIACFYATCFVFIAVVLNAIARLHGFRLWRLIKYIKEELFIVYGTSSSESVLPRIMAKLENLGVHRSVVGLVIPAGYSFNLDGSAIYLSIATVFIAQATNTPLDLKRQLTLLAVLLLTSKGAAGVAGAALIVLAATLATTGAIPVAGVTLVLGIHRFMGEAMAVTNLIGNAVATIVVGTWCGQVDEGRLRAHLSHESAGEADEPERVARGSAGEVAARR
jgi:aerobic C4-dicarboxylate transport protein